MSIVILSIIGVFIQIYLKIDEEPIQEEIKQDNIIGHDVSLNDPKIINGNIINTDNYIYFDIEWLAITKIFNDCTLFENKNYDFSSFIKNK